MPVRRSDQLSYEATESRSWSFEGSNVPMILAVPSPSSNAEKIDISQIENTITIPIKSLFPKALLTLPDQTEGLQLI